MQYPFEHTLAIFIEHQVKECGDDLLAVGLTGSAANGTIRKDSDLDIVVLWRRAQSERRRMTIDGILCDVFLDHPAAIGAILRSASVRFRVSMIAKARALLDPAQILEALIIEAREVWNNGPKGVERGMSFRWNCELADTLKAIRRSSDQDDLTFHAGSLIATFSEILWAQRGSWGVPKVEMMKHLRMSVPEAYADVTALCDSTLQIGQRKAAAESLVTRLGEERLGAAAPLIGLPH